jgi:hypothetical protein
MWASSAVAVNPAIWIAVPRHNRLTLLPNNATYVENYVRHRFARRLREQGYRRKTPRWKEQLPGHSSIDGRGLNLYAISLERASQSERSNS